MIFRSVIRYVSRALVFDDAGRILLLHWRDPLTGHEFLEPPGGRREAGETDEDALRREVAEETGLVDVETGAFVVEIDHAFTFGSVHYDCRERYYACRAGGSELHPTRLDKVESEGIVGIEWWAVEDLEGRLPNSLEPPRLLEMIEVSQSRAGLDCGVSRDRHRDQAWRRCHRAKR
jgi:8-oxo-dGTP pyrophosphatase MutT (NUDIX family)